MRKLMWFTIGFAAACALWAYEMSGSWIIPAVILSCVAALAGLILRRRWNTVPTVLVCVGCILGLGWFQVYRSAYLLPAAGLDETVVSLIVEATDYSELTDYGVCVDGVLNYADRTYHLRAYLDTDREVAPGDRIYGKFRLRFTAPDEREEATHHRGNGIFLLAYSEEIVAVLPGRENALRFMPARMGREIAYILECFFPEDTAPFARALLLGDTSGLTYQQDTDLKLSGIRHVVAVSGLHVSILFAMVSTLTLKRPWLKALIGFPVLALFAAMAGFTPSVARACLMCALMLFAMLTRRDYDGATALSFSALMMMLLNPLVVTSVAFQLSVGSVAGIYLFQKPVQTWMLSRLGDSRGKSPAARLKRWFASSVSVTLSAMSITTPMSAWYFGTVSLVGILTNLLTLWVISVIFYGIIGVCLLSLVWNGGALLLAKLCSIPIRYVLLVARLLGDFPLAAVYACSVYIVAWLVFCYLLLTVFLLQKERRPVVFSCVAALGLCLALLASWIELRTDSFRMTVMDVGQGQSILLYSEGKTFLVDCGGDSDTQTADVVAQTLLSQGVQRLDGIILTHTDRDHAGALDNLLTRIDADRILFPASGEAPADGEAVLPGEEVSFSFPEGSLTVYGPITSAGGNENSLCILFEQKNCAILITGDRSGFGERMLLRAAKLPDVDILVAGHHGDDDSATRELLEAVKPETVIISVGADNPYGLPGKALLQRLEQFGCQIIRTDRSGTITYRR